VDIAAVRADTVFAAFRDHLRAGRLEQARESLRGVKSHARNPAEREVAEFDLIELDFFAGRFDTALAAYRIFATGHPRGYLTNDAIGRVFLIDENSDTGRRPLVLYATAAMEARVGRPDSSATLLKQGVLLYPGSALADDLILALGDVALKSATPAVALQRYQAVADSMPDSPLAPAAMMRIGKYRSEIDQDFAAAISTYEQVLQRFPDTLEADEARKLIERLRRGT
jgi:TolA-binding protein